MIRHLLHSDIDKAWWDTQLLRCSNRLWYAQSWVLDIAAPNWEALVDDATGAIMPLTWRRKWGINYLFTPYSVQQLGVFAPTMDDAVSAPMLEAIPKRFRYWDIWLNADMHARASGGDVLHENANQLLDLGPGIDVLRAAYSEGHRRNLRKARPNDDARDVSTGAFVDLFMRTTGARFGNVPPGADVMLRTLLRAAHERGQCRIPAIWQDEEAIAAVCFIQWEGRIILLKSARDERGQEQRAMFHLVDAEIAQHAGSGRLFDFAGSNTPSVARFNAGFGARSTVYLRLVRNRLPPPLRWLKR